MDKKEWIEKIYLKKEEISKIINEIKKYQFDDYIKSSHYEISLLTKCTNEQNLKEIYLQFDKIKLIMLRKRKNGYENYDIHYELEKGNYAIFAIHFNKNTRGKPTINNAFITNKIFKNFLRAIIKRYGKI